MTQDPRLALEELIAAFRAHFDLGQSDVEIDSDEFIDAEERLANAFFTYDDVLFTHLEVELPFEIVGEEEFDDDDFDDDEFDDEDFDDDDLDEDEDEDDLDEEDDLDDDEDFIDVDD